MSLSSRGDGLRQRRQHRPHVVICGVPVDMLRSHARRTKYLVELNDWLGSGTDRRGVRQLLRKEGSYVVSLDERGPSPAPAPPNAGAGLTGPRTAHCPDRRTAYLGGSER